MTLSPPSVLAKLSVLAGLALAASACGSSPPASSSPDAGAPRAETGAPDATTTPDDDTAEPTDAMGAPDAGTACAPSAGVSASPSSIADAVALMNDLLAQGRSQVTIACFVESLARPLGVLAVNSVLSAQPADGPHNPRVFLFSRNLVLSVVPDGRASSLLELAEYVSPVRSIKAEIVFPRVAPTSLTSTYNRIVGTGGTVCGACHRDEMAADNVDGLNAFVSNVLRPREADEVPLSSVETEAAACDHAAQPERCAIFDAILAHGSVQRQTFSPDAPTIYD